MSFKINDSEEEALLDEPDHLYKLYMGIRKFMDYKTGVSGENRLLSESFFVERLSYSARPGRKKYICSREKVRTSIRYLEKLGLIKHLGDYVFLCILADKDQSVQKIINQGTTIGATKGTTKKSKNKYLNNNEYSKEVQPEVNRITPPRYNPPPGTGGDIVLFISKNEINNTSASCVQKNIKNPELYKLAAKVLEHLNKRTNRGYRPVDGTLQHIVARLESGVTVEDCLRVIDDRWRKWGNDSKMHEYLRPKTLFCLSNFENYLGGLSAPTAEKKAPEQKKCCICGGEGEVNQRGKDFCGKHSLLDSNPDRYKSIYGNLDP